MEPLIMHSGLPCTLGSLWVWPMEGVCRRFEDRVGVSPNVVSWTGLLDVSVWLLPSTRPSDPAKGPFKLSSLSGTLWQECLSFGAKPGVIQCPYDFPRSSMYFIKLINLLV